MFFRATLFSAFGGSKRWLGTNSDGTTRPLTTADFYKAVRSTHTQRGQGWVQHASLTLLILRRAE